MRRLRDVVERSAGVLFNVDTTVGAPLDDGGDLVLHPRPLQ